MTELNKSIIEMIEQNRSMKDIALNLNISPKELYVRIKQIINYGYQLEPSYCYNSDIYYRIEKGIKDCTSTKSNVSIKMPSSTKEFRCIGISDTHIGNKESDIDLLKRVYEYAALNNINTIFNCGDLIEGVHTTDSKSLSTVDSQIEYLIKKHPYDKNINNFVILGNHDYHSLHYDGIDLMKKIKNCRYDIIPIGYGEGIVNVKEDCFALEHNLSVIDNPNNTNTQIVLVGHGHMMKTKVYDKLYICLPTLSRVSPDKTREVIPGFIDMIFHLDKGKFDFIELKHLLIAPKIIQVSESRCRMKTLYKVDNNYNKSKWK